MAASVALMPCVHYVQGLEMENLLGSSKRRFQDHVFVWDRKFATRQEDAHRHENNRLIPEDDESIVDAFLSQFGSRLDPPQYSYTALRNFLNGAAEEDLKTDPASTISSQSNILLDDRCDSTGWYDISNVRHSARDWNSYAGGYPPEGEGVVFNFMSAGELYRKRLQSVS